MTVVALLKLLREKQISLTIKNNSELAVQGNKLALSDPAMLALLREHKQALIEMIKAGEDLSPQNALVQVPPNGIPAGCSALTPAMLPLVKLSFTQIESIVAHIPGAAANVQDIYPLTPLQEGILFHHLMAEHGDPYLLSGLAAFNSREQLDRYLGAMQSVVNRHDILRTSILWEGLPEPVQVVQRKAALRIEEVALDANAGDASDQLYARFDPRHYRIDLREAPLLRFFIAYDAVRERWLMLELLHHVAGDHTTLDILQEEIHAHLLGREQELPAPLPFRNLVAQARLGISNEQHETFFKNMLGDIDEPTAPFGLLQVQGDGTGIAQAQLDLEAALSERIRAHARRLGVSAASLCHLAWALVLARVTGRQSVVFGTVLFGRMHGGDGADRILGLFINTLPLRIDMGEYDALVGVQRTHTMLAELLRHEHASLALAQRCSNVSAPTPLFSSLLNYRHMAPATLVADESMGMEVVRSVERTNYPLTLSVDDLGVGFRLVAQVEAAIDPARVCAFMQAGLASLVGALERAPGHALRDLDVLPPDERQLLLHDWNDTAQPFPHDRCVHQLFEEQVARAPEAIALVFEDQQLSYAQLNRRANQLAHYLRQCGVKPDARVAICVERGFEMVIGLLAVLKAGGAYVPMDPAYPVERLRFMLDDAAPVVVLTQSHLAALFDQHAPAAPVLLLDGDTAAWSSQPDENLDPHALHLAAHHLAYVIYTSGSTGTPKGVMVEHRNVTRLFYSTEAWFQFTHTDVWTLFHSFAFDFSVWEIWGALLYGGQLIVVPLLVARSPQAFYDLLSQRKVTILNQTPSAFRQLISTQGDSLKEHCLRHVIFGGEALDTTLLDPWYERQINRQCRLINMYGITETTVHATYRELADEPARRQPGSSIGQRLPDLRIYLLDRYGRPAPVGVEGELYIGGAGVARGYLNQPALTAERFLSDTFASIPGARMFRTGDLGRWLPDGSIEFLGRNDFQVKIRGFRIELGEIEARLGNHPAVREAVVLAREDEPGDKRLVAYYVTDTQSDNPGVDTLRGHLSGALPEHMVPAAYVRLPALPLTPNGKLDRNALPAPDADAYSVQDYAPPQGDTEILLAALFAEVLKCERVGRHDNFFELGGHSLSAVTLIERIRQSGVQTDVRTLFATPTVARLAAAVPDIAPAVPVPPNGIPAGCSVLTPAMLPLVKLSFTQIESIVARIPGAAVNVQDIYPLTPLQEGILFHHLMAEHGDPYLLFGLAAFNSREQLDRYLGAMQSVVNRHDILRTSILWEGLPEPVQVVQRKAILRIEEVALDTNAGDASDQLYARFDPRHYRIDLREAPLLRFFIAYDAARERWLMLELLHHMAGDHTAFDILQEEIHAHLLGREQELPAPLPFRNLVAQARLGISNEQHETFFKNMLGDIDEPTAPFGLLQVQGDGTGIAQAQLDLEAALSERIRAHARRLGVSAASLCHLAWALVLARVTGRQSVVFGTVLFGRMHGGDGADRVTGPFINTLPLRVDLADQNVVDSVRRTQLLLAELLHHEHASLAFAQRCSGVKAPAPLFSSLFNYRHIAKAAITPSNAPGGTEWIAGEERTNYPCTMAVDDLDEGFRVVAQVDSGLDPERVCGFLRTALEVLVSTLEHAPNTPIRELDVLPTDERRKLLEDWNATQADYPALLCVHQMFEAQARHAPEAVAVTFEEHQICYGKLNQRSNQLAHHLRAMGVRPNDRVAVCIERGIETIIGLLAILKAGGVYVPMDPSYPVERLRFMLHDSAPVVVLTQTHLSALFDDGGKASSILLRLDDDWASWQDQLATDPDPVAVHLTPEHVAYVIYTSGSTGAPKGVMVDHRQLVARLSGIQTSLAFRSDDVMPNVSSSAFDISLLETLLPLVSGGQSTILDMHRVKDMDYLIEHTRTMTVFNAVTSLMEVWSRAVPREAIAQIYPKLRMLLVGGEPVSQRLLNRLSSHFPASEVIETYGPTEAALYCTSRLERSGTENEGWPPIGRPIPNTRIYILNAQGQPAPVGVEGELHVGGTCVARGYLNRPELTAQRFVRDPFVTDRQARMYRTGDLGRWLPDGNIEFLGRNDFQVKVRGFRIELGEIEAKLAEYPGICDVAVLAREDVPGDKRLVAYYVPSSLDTISGQPETGAEAFRAHLRDVLPEYMIPSAYVRLEALPLTPNGKLDRNALSAPNASAYSQRGYEAPIGDRELLLATLFAEVLNLDRVGRHDNFFELGGNSLTAVRLIERMRHSGAHADVRALFATPTVADLASLVSNAESTVQVPPNSIPAACTALTPDMLPLVELTQAQIERIVLEIPGGHGNIQDIYPLAPLQEGILFHHLLEREGDPYLGPSLMAFDSRERLDTYIDAMQAIVDRHDILRTAFFWEGLSEPVQVVQRKAHLCVEQVQLDANTDTDAARQLYVRFSPRHYRIDLQKAPLIRLFMAYDAMQDRWLLLMLQHHLIGDHTTLDLLGEEIHAHLRGHEKALPAPLPFRNLVAHARLGVSTEQHKAFFTQMLGDVDTPTAPFGLLEVHGDHMAMADDSVDLDPELSSRIRSNARRLGVSPASLCHLAWALVLARVSGRQDVVFGTVLFGRMAGGEGADRVMGPFINTLPLLIRIGEQSVRDSVRHTQVVLAELLRHEHASLALAQRCSRVPAPAPLFSALLNYRHIAPGVQPTSNDALEGTEWIDGEERTTYPFDLSIDDLGEGFRLVAQVADSIDPLRICEFVQTALAALVTALELAPDTPVIELDLLPPAERRLVLHEWNETAQPFPQDKCVHQLFEEQVARTPDAIAAVFEDRELTYAELNSQANRLAHYLREHGVKPDDRVAICMERGLEMVVGLLAVLKAGGAYVPMDLAYPDERLAFMLKDSEARLLLTQSRFATRFAETPCLTTPLLALDAETLPWRHQSDSDTPPVLPEGLAYVIYTSGSTGAAKGVLVEHRSVVNRIIWMRNSYRLSVDDVVLHKAPLAFDVSVWEILVPLSIGARLVIAKPEGHKDPTYLIQTVRRHQVSLVDFVPAMLQLFLEHEGVSGCTSLLHILCGGEALSPALARQCRELLPKASLHHMYGPTETTVDATTWVCPAQLPESALPIGRPIANTRIYVLDKRADPVPVGVAGELYIGGAGVARGYLNQPELTAERFLSDPFAAEPHARMYRTGDLGRWLADGNIEFLGRDDFQVKVRGFRIELGEIEARLVEHPSVIEAVVLARDDDHSDKRLVAYYRTSGHETLDAQALRSHLSSRLPEYMVPAAYVWLDALPLTPNGKLDRRALPAPDAHAYSVRGYEPPQGETETLLAHVWAQVLKLERVGRHDNFFDLGGHSLLAVQLMSRIRQSLRLDLQLTDVFGNPTLIALAHHLDSVGRTELPPITRAPRDRTLPLSFAQQRLWFLAQIEGVSEAYHIPLGLNLHGKLDRPALQRALEQIVARHEALRTRFVSVDGIAVQHIAPIEHSRLTLLEHDLRECDNASALLSHLAGDEVRTAFNLEDDLLIRGRLVRLADEQHVLLLTLHHIVSDGWSMGIWLNEFSALYSAYRQGLPDPLPPLPLQYADYAIWQRQWIEGGVLEQQARYWKQALADAPPLLELPTDHARPAQQDYSGAVVDLMLDAALTQNLKALGKRHGTTLYMTLLTAWAVLLSRLSGQTDIVIGTPAANRGRAELEGLIGFFVNTLAVRLQLDGSPSVQRALELVKMQALAAQQHQDLPFEQVVELARPARSLAYSPLFQVMFAWQNAPQGTLVLPGLQVSPVVTDEHHVAKFDLTLSLEETGDTIRGGIEYACALFDPATVQRYAGYFTTLLHAMADDPDQTIDRLPMLPAQERQQLLYDWNDTATPFPRERCVHELFEQQAREHPDALAVVFDDQQLHYGELNRRANQLAHHLRELGVRPDDRVAICVERGLDMVIGLLAVLKAGGAYVPIDPAYPLERLAYMLVDCAPVALLTQTSLANRVEASRNATLPVLLLDGQDAPWFRQLDTNLDVAQFGLTPEHLAYVMYTSGSTGTPKGVMVQHGNIVRLVRDTNYIQLNPMDAIAQASNISFDAATFEIWGALLNGARLVIVPKEALLDYEHISMILERHQITIFWLTVGLFNQYADRLSDSFSRLRCLLVGGDALDPHAIRGVLNQGAPQHLINGYGPTETTTFAATYEIASVPSGSRSIPIGRPIANTRIYVLDKRADPVPVGVAGELYIGGAGVARGYLNQPELTAERFLSDPFAAEPHARMYRTGDLGRWLADGNIEFLGRDDFQVKVRGFRIELGEIEARLVEHPSVIEAVVLARDDDHSDKRLVAYYRTSGHETLDAQALRSHLSSRLPEYMVPAAYVWLDALPLTPNGKLDRRALPAPDAHAYSVRGYEPPQGETETLLAHVWAQVLKLERVGRHDNFFDLGGHSLLAVQLMSRIRQSLRLDLQLTDVFGNPTLIALAHHLDSVGRTELPPITRAPRDRTLPLSFAQQRLWFLAQIEGVSEAYHIPLGLNLHGKLDRPALQRALEQIVARHEALRTRFVSVDGIAVQHIAPIEHSRLTLLEHDLRECDNASALLSHLAGDEVRTAFNLEDDLLIRGRLVRLADEQHVLLLTLHHIVSDGWSMGIWLNEFSALYSAYRQGLPDPLPPLPLQYADYAIWQRQWIEGGVLEQQARYWKQALADAPPLLELPTDHARPAQQDYSGAVVDLMLDAALTQNLKALGKRHGTTLYMTLLTAWAVLLSRLSGQTDIVIGTPAANRGRAELEGLIGFFVNTLAVRLQLDGSPSVQRALELVKMQALAAQQHQDLPFEQVVELARPARSLAYSPLFQVMFAWQNAPQGTLVLPGLQVSPVVTDEHHVAKFDLTLSLEETGDTIRGGIEYACALFDPATVQRYAGYFTTLLHAMADDPDQTIDRLPMLPAQERQQLLYDWNDTATPFPRERCVHELFEQQAREHPDALAVVFDDQQLHYGELNRRANQLAHHLRELGVRPDDRVAICVERGLDMVIGLLAVLKAGGAYVPIDPAYPLERLAYMLVDCAPVAVLTESTLRERLASLQDTVPVPVLELDTQAPSWRDQPDTDLAPQVVGLSSRHLAYVIYTSGSTGTPKGVMVEHRNVTRLFYSTEAWFQFTHTDVWTLFHSFAFDFSVWEIWGALLYGGQLIVVPLLVARSPQAFYDLLSQRKVTILNQTPSAFRQLISTQGDSLKEHCLRHVIFGGEALDTTLLDPWYERQINRQCRLINMYGITETTVHATYRELADEPARRQPGSSIGQRLPDLRIYLLDRYGRPAPVGVEGELYIGGAGVARGYLNQPALTAERFLSDTFASIPGARMFRTGDLGRWLPDGSIEFLGRNDFQVKVRGFRIELGEIEARLVEHPSVIEAVVLARDDDHSDKRLVAYYRTSGHETLDAQALRSHLSSRLPEYMVPAAYVWLDALPLTPNGKLDRRALPAPDAHAYSVRGYEPPQGETETLLAHVWAQVLKLERVGRHDNFFDLGGHSLLAVKLVDQLAKHAIRLPLATIFSHPTIASVTKNHFASASASANDSACLIRQGLGDISLFLVHDGAGELFYAQHLSHHIDPRLNLYGLPSDNNDHPTDTIESMASRHIANMRDLQPSGPYYLAGWSFGGLLAFEIASQLSRTGEEIGFLGMIDTIYTRLVDGIAGDVSHIDDARSLFLECIRQEVFRADDDHPDFQRLQAISNQMDLDSLIQRCGEMNMMPGRLIHLSSGHVQRQLLREHNYHRIAARYLAPASPAHVHLFQANELSTLQPCLGWSSVVGEDQLTLQWIPGNHHSMLQGSNVLTLAQALSFAISCVTKTETRMG